MTTLSLIVAAPIGAEPEPFLAALDLAGGRGHPQIEILISEAWTRPVGQARPGVRLLTAAGAASIFELWGSGIRAAKGRYLAILDLRCPIEPGWIETVLSAIADSPPVMFGPVDCAWPRSDQRFLGYLVEYAQFHPPMAQEMGEIPGVNLILQRDLALHPTVLRHDGFKKTRVLPLLNAMPRPMRLPGAAVRYRKACVSGAYYAHRFDHGRTYGAERAFSGQPWARLAAIASTALLPIVRIGRIYPHAVRLPGGRRTFWRFFLRILAAETAWSAGELVGYWAGAGRSSGRLR